MLRSRVGIFLNERTQSTSLDSKLMFWCISYYLGAFGPFGCLIKLGAKRAELVQKFMPRSCVESFRDESTRSTPLDPKLMFWCVPYHFGTVWLPYKTGANRAELMQKFVPRSRVGSFLNECTRWYETHQNMSLGSNGGGSGAFVVINSDTTSCHELLHLFRTFCPEFCKAT